MRVTALQGAGMMALGGCPGVAARGEFLTSGSYFPLPPPIVLGQAYIP